MEDFYAALEGKLKNFSTDKRTQLMTVVKEAFDREAIEFDQLMESSNLAITDADLKEYGISQGGLRKAILSVIQSQQQ